MNGCSVYLVADRGVGGTEGVSGVEDSAFGVFTDIELLRLPGPLLRREEDLDDDEEVVEMVDCRLAPEGFSLAERCELP